MVGFVQALMRPAAGAIPRIHVISIVTLFLGALAFGPGLGAAEAEPREIRVVTHTVTPFVMENGGQRTGFTIDLWDEIAKRSGWTTVYQDVPDVTGQLAALDDETADVAAAAISITSEREERYDFSQPIYYSGLQILERADRSEHNTPNLFSFLKLLLTLPMLVWLGTAILIGLVPAHIYWLIERRHPDGDVARSYFPGILQATQKTVGSLVGAGDASPRHWIGRLLLILWAFIGIVFVAFYTANLTAHLTVQKFDSQIKGPADLYGKKVATVAGSTAAEYLARNAIPATEMPDSETAMRAVTDGFDAAVADSPVMHYFVTHQGGGAVRVAGPVFEAEDYGLVFPAHSELRKQVNAAILSRREDGTYDRISHTWFGDADDDDSDGDAN